MYSPDIIGIGMFWPALLGLISAPLSEGQGCIRV